MSAAQEKILQVIEDDGQAKVLANIWQMIEGSPLQAAKILRALEQSSAAVKAIGNEIPEAWQRLDGLCLDAEVKRSQFIEDLRTFRKETLTEMNLIADSLLKLKGTLAAIDEDKVLNKANRVIEIVEKLSKAKKDGSLDVLKKLLP